MSGYTKPELKELAKYGDYHMKMLVNEVLTLRELAKERRKDERRAAEEIQSLSKDRFMMSCALGRISKLLGKTHKDTDGFGFVITNEIEEEIQSLQDRNKLLEEVVREIADPKFPVNALGLMHIAKVALSKLEDVE